MSDRVLILRQAWENIDSHIRKGDLGPERNAQRNGMILAANIIMDMIDQTRPAVTEADWQ